MNIENIFILEEKHIWEDLKMTKYSSKNMYFTKMKPFKYEAKYFLIQWWPELHLWYLWRPCVTWPGHTCLVMRDVTETRRLSPTRLRWLRWLRMMDRGGGGCSDQIQWRYINILRYFNTSRMLSSCTRYIYLDIPKLTFWHFIFRTTCLDLMLKINCPPSDSRQRGLHLEVK